MAPRKIAKPPVEPTEYVVLEYRQIDYEPDKVFVAWVEVGRLTAHGNEHTILKKWAEAEKRGGSFKLVPLRSWKGGHRFFEQTTIASEPLDGASATPTGEKAAKP